MSQINYKKRGYYEKTIVATLILSIMCSCFSVGALDSSAVEMFIEETIITPDNTEEVLISSESESMENDEFTEQSVETVTETDNSEVAPCDLIDKYSIYLTQGWTTPYTLMEDSNMWPSDDTVSVRFDDAPSASNKVRVAVYQAADESNNFTLVDEWETIEDGDTITRHIQGGYQFQVRVAWVSGASGTHEFTVTLN